MKKFVVDDHEVEEIEDDKKELGINDYQNLIFKEDKKNIKIRKRLVKRRKGMEAEYHMNKNIKNDLNLNKTERLCKKRLRKKRDKKKELEKGDE